MKQNQKQQSIKAVEMFNNDLKKEVNFQISDRENKPAKANTQQSIHTDTDGSDLARTKKKKNNVMTKAQARRYIARMEKSVHQEELREPHIQKSKFFVHSKLTNDYRVGVIKRAVSNFDEQKLKKACQIGYFSLKETIDQKNRLRAKEEAAHLPFNEYTEHMMTIEGSQSQSIRSKKVDFFKEFVQKADNTIKIDL